MSISNILGFDGKIIPGVLPNPYPFPASASGLGAVLAVNNSALTPTGPPVPQSITDVGTLSAANIQAPFGSILALNSDLIQNGVTANLGILPAGNLSLLPTGNISIKGAQTKGSMLVGDGTSTKELIVPVAPALPNGSVLILDSNEPLGMKWGGESGDINSITPGNNIDIIGNPDAANPIVAVRNPLNATLNLGSQNITGGLGLATPNSSWNYQGLNFFVGGPGGGSVEAIYGPNSVALTTPATNTGDVLIEPTRVKVQGPSNSTPSFTQIEPLLTTIQIQNGITNELQQTTLASNTITTAYNSNTTITADANSFVSAGGSGTTLNYNDVGTATSSFAQVIAANLASQQIIIQDLTATPNPAGASYTMGLSTATPGAPTAVISMAATTPTTSPFPNIDANATLSVATNAASLSLSQSAPFANTTTMTLDLNNLTHNQGTGSASPDDDFTITTNKTLLLQTTGAFPINLETPVGQQINIINGNTISLTGGNYISEYRQDGVSITETITGVSLAKAELIAGSGNAQMFVGAGNLATPNTHYVRVETSLGGDALIEHQTTSGTARNLAITSDGNATIQPTGVLSLIGGGIIANAGTTAGNSNSTQFLASGVGGQSFPIVRMENTNATGSVALEVYKNKSTAGSNGDVLFNQSVYGKDSTNAKQEYTRITHTIRDATAGAEDGSMELGCFVNGGFANFIQLNANDTPIGEVNFTRPLDFIGGSDANSTIKVSGAGSVNLNLDTTNSAGAGAIVLNTKTGTAGSGAGLNLKGNTLTDVSAGGSAGQYLCLTINSVVYKIALLNI